MAVRSTVRPNARRRRQPAARRLLVAGLVGVVAAALTACGPGPSPMASAPHVAPVGPSDAPRSATVAATARVAEPVTTSVPAPTSGGESTGPTSPLPVGDLLPGHRFVALYGSPGIAGLGALGRQDLPAAVDRVRELAAQYQPLSDVPVVPMFEIIATIADVAPGEDGDYSAEIDPQTLLPWIEAAQAAGILVVIDLQPGRTDFLTQAKRYENLLREPNVGLALDPEWRLRADQVHLEQIGSVDAAEVNAVGDWLAALTRDAGLPQKMFLLHQFRLSMLRNESAIVMDRPELATVIQMDGQGSQAAKDETWAAVTAAAPPGTPFGWKNFYRADDTLLDPAATMAKSPTPVLISYE